MKIILSISNKMWGFKFDASNNVYKVNVDASFKILNNVTSYTPLNVSILNFDKKMR
jgi:hypothetical protein